MRGESNRQKLAETFLPPVTFKDYCSLISATNCSMSDDSVVRPPAEDGSEDGKYFLLGAYTGYFHATEENDCTVNPNCTGHYADYPCGWTSYFLQQSHHLDIALKGVMYNYTELVEIWSAANATKSDLIGLWWQPDATSSDLAGTDAEMMEVSVCDRTILYICLSFCVSHS